MTAPAFRTSIHRFKRVNAPTVRYYVLARDAATGELIAWGGPYSNVLAASEFAAIFEPQK